MVKKKKLNPAAQIVFGFLGIILIGTLLLCLPISSNNGQWFSFVDSMLTSTSSVCVTGLIVVDTAVVNIRKEPTVNKERMVIL